MPSEAFLNNDMFLWPSQPGLFFLLDELCTEKWISKEWIFLPFGNVCGRDSSIWTWHAPGMAVGAWEHFVPAASVGRREERGAGSELCGDGSEVPCEQEQRGAQPEPVCITAEVRNSPPTVPLPCLLGHSTAGGFS